MADDPEEELFAVVVEEAAMGGVCEFEVGLLMDSVVEKERGRRVEEGGRRAAQVASWWIGPDDVVAGIADPSEQEASGLLRY